MLSGVSAVRPVQVSSTARGRPWILLDLLTAWASGALNVASAQVVGSWPGDTSATKHHLASNVSIAEAEDPCAGVTVP